MPQPGLGSSRENLSPPRTANPSRVPSFPVGRRCRLHPRIKKRWQQVGSTPLPPGPLRPAAPTSLPGPARGLRWRPAAPPACAPPPPPCPGKAAAAGPAGGPGQSLEQPAHERAAAGVPTRSGRHLPAPHGSAAPQPSHRADEPRPAARSVPRSPSRAPLTAIQTPPRAARRTFDFSMETLKARSP